MKFAGVELDHVADVLKDGYIQPYVPLGYSKPKTDKDGNWMYDENGKIIIESGYYWEGKEIPSEKCDASFWAEVEKKYPTIRVTGEEVKQMVNSFEGLPLRKMN